MDDKAFAKRVMQVCKTLSFEDLKRAEEKLLRDLYDNGLTPQMFERILSFNTIVILSANNGCLSPEEYGTLLCDIASFMVIQ